MYKDELQQKNEKKLQDRFNEVNAPTFIRRYFINIESRAGAITYWIAIKDLLQWLLDKKIIDKNHIANIEATDFYDVEAEDITLYLREKENNGMSPTTLETRKNIYSSFWNYLVRSRKCPVKDNIIEYVSYKGISSNNNLIKKLPSEDEIYSMGANILRKKDPFVRIRNYAVLKVLMGSGIRESELAGLDINDIYFNCDMPYIKVIGKGVYREQEARIVYLTGEATKAIQEWLIERNKTKDKIVDVDAVFINKRGKRLNEDNIKAIFRNYSSITPHMIRHYYATVMTNKCGVAFAQQQLGHTSMTTTINTYANGSYGMKDILKEM